MLLDTYPHSQYGSGSRAPKCIVSGSTTLIIYNTVINGGESFKEEIPRVQTLDFPRFCNLDFFSVSLFSFCYPQFYRKITNFVIRSSYSKINTGTSSQMFEGPHQLLVYHGQLLHFYCRTSCRIMIGDQSLIPCKCSEDTLQIRAKKGL
jgi:hypothetical protein